MNQRDARQEGINAGYGIGLENARDYTDFDQYMIECLEHESELYRQYSPFEFLAQAMNEDEDRAEGIWEAYENGVAAGLRKAWRDTR